MKIIQCVSALYRDYGGPSRSVPQLAEAMAENGAQVVLVTARDAGRESVPLSPVVKVRYVDDGSDRGWRQLLSSGFRKEVAVSIDKGQTVVHSHGVWRLHSHGAIAAARGAGAPVVLSPRGMLEPWAMAFRSWKKRLAWGLYQRRDLELVSAFHATSDMEAESIRRLGFRQPIVVLPNGIRLPPATELDVPKRKRQALFLSRIHEKKGLDLLVRAWARVRPRDWQLVIAGNNDGGYADVVKKLIIEESVADSISLIGPAYGDAKDRLYRESSLFVLPSHSENFGIVVAEALGHGIPVITTHGTPWAELNNRRCGWHIPIEQNSLENALHEATSLEAEELVGMGKAGRVLVEERYAWPYIAERMQIAYRAILAGSGDDIRTLSWVRTG